MVGLRRASVLGEIAIVVVGVLLAVAADRWNTARQDRASAEAYLQELEVDLRSDTAALGAEIARAEYREEAARLMLGVVFEGRAIDDPADFVLRVVNASTYGEPVQARETFDDLVQTGRLGLIRDPALRRKLTEYYQFIERRSQSYDLQRQRVWGDYLPISVKATPLALQEWAYGDRRRRATDLAAPTAAQAAAVARSLAASPDLETALKGVARSTWSLVDNWSLMRSRAEELLGMLERRPRG